MNNDPNRSRRDDNVAAVPITSTPRRFNPLWFLLLLLIPLLLLPFCHHRDDAPLAGYTDNSGSAEVNKQLTQQRVNNVKSALTGAGVDAGRIATASFGEAYPVTDNSNPQARELNRRVEITLAH